MAEDQILNPEQGVSPDLPPQHSEALISLDFHLDGDTRQLQSETTEFLKLGSIEQFRESIGRFHDATAMIADAATDEDRPRIMTGIALTTAEIHLRAGNKARYLEDLREVIIQHTRKFSDNPVYELLDDLRLEMEEAGIEAPVSDEWLQFLLNHAQVVDGLDTEEATGYITGEMFRYGLDEDDVARVLAQLEIL